MSLPLDKKEMILLQLRRMQPQDLAEIAQAIRCSWEETKLLLSELKSEGLLGINEYPDFHPTSYFLSRKGGEFADELYTARYSLAAIREKQSLESNGEIDR